MINLAGRKADVEIMSRVPEKKSRKHIETREDSPRCHKKTSRSMWTIISVTRGTNPWEEARRQLVFREEEEEEEKEEEEAGDGNDTA